MVLLFKKKAPLTWNYLGVIIPEYLINPYTWPSTSTCCASIVQCLQSGSLSKIPTVRIKQLDAKYHSQRITAHERDAGWKHMLQNSGFLDFFDG